MIRKKWPIHAPITIGLLLITSAGSRGDNADVNRKEEYVSAVTQGAGFLPWQQKGISDKEGAFRQAIECRKDELLANRINVKHPALLTREDIERAQKNMQSSDWAQRWFKSRKNFSDYMVRKSEDYIKDMIPELSPTNPYGFTCPNCVGRKSQEAAGTFLIVWNHKNPDVCSCRLCGQVYPSEKYPETAKLVCPRSGQVFTYYINEQERAHPEDRSGKYAYHWVGYPVHVSFTGVIRGEKILFMITAAKRLAYAYQFTHDDRYARQAIRILVRLADCYRNWLYHDYWDTIADCDPLYAAFHYHELALEWKRHLCGDAYKKDTPDRAAMLQSYWGAGRLHPSCDIITYLGTIAQAYDLVYDARDDKGRSLWKPADRSKVERDLILEYALGAEPFVGGPNKATNVSNKAPRVYRPQAIVAKCLGLTNLADTALRGYEAVRDRAFCYDGFSHESPLYNNAFLSEIVRVPEQLHGFRWPTDFEPRQGVVDYYKTDNMLRLMLRAMIDQLRPDGRYPPLADTSIDYAPQTHLIELGCKRYPEYFDGTLPALYRDRKPGEYALFHLDADQITRDKGLNLPEICLPVFRTAIMRHGRGPESAMLTLTFSPAGGHRHNDNLSVFYTDGGHTMLGDQGYVCDMPNNTWIRSTLSHNLVIVDNAEQLHGGRQPQLRRFVTSDKVSVSEASSKVYDQCSDYRRLVVLIKGPGGQTFAVDIFRVRGGKRHDYRLFSELASSDAQDGKLEFAGFDMPEEKPLPQVGGSLAGEDIFGLRDIRGVDRPPAGWQAVWKQSDRQFRVWMLCQAHGVEASNGPGQEIREQMGRRVRYLNVVRQGQDLASTFVCIHEPSGPSGKMPIHRVERLPVPESAGADAVALRIESDWGAYLVLSEFSKPTEVAGVRFAGELGIINQAPDGRCWMLTSGVSTLLMDDFGFEGASPAWTGKITSHTDRKLIADSARPAEWQPGPGNVEFTSYVLVRAHQSWTGFPVHKVNENSIEIGRFPLPPSSEFTLEQVRLITYPCPAEYTY
ncbi:MAG: heparinase II/III domain-containing protein [Planctomycetota bacterium]|jgi:hypothetical protein